MGQASVRVDQRSPELREAWFDQTWGGYRQTTVLARDLGPGKHHVRIQLLPEKHPQSTGHDYLCPAAGWGRARRPGRCHDKIARRLELWGRNLPARSLPANRVVWQMACGERVFDELLTRHNRKPAFKKELNARRSVR